MIHMDTTIHRSLCKLQGPLSKITRYSSEIGKSEDKYGSNTKRLVYMVDSHN